MPDIFYRKNEMWKSSWIFILKKEQLWLRKMRSVQRKKKGKLKKRGKKGRKEKIE